MKISYINGDGKLLFLTLLMMFLYTTETHAQQTSLFFTEKETLEIYKKLEKAPKNEQELREIISLDGIVYKTSDNWTVWINGTPITPEIQAGIDFKITNVTPSSVRLFIEDDKQNPRTILLRLNQSANRRTGKISEGKV